MADRSVARSFCTLVLVAQALGIALVVCMIVWLTSFRGGFAWTEDPGKQFNYHPLLMTLGMVFLFGDAILMYRIFRNQRKITIKWLHFLVQLVAFILSVVGLQAVFSFHNLSGIPNMYSLHSWLGMGTIVCFAAQLVGGFVTFLKPQLNEDVRSRYLPVHVYAGIAMFVLACATALLGLTEKALFMMDAIHYSKFSNEGILINIIGLLFVAFTAVACYVVTEPSYRRLERPYYEPLQCQVYTLHVGTPRHHHAPVGVFAGPATTT